MLLELNDAVCGPFISLCIVLYCYLQTIPQPSQAITLLTLHNVSLHYITLHYITLQYKRKSELEK